jgi:carboxypeptidase C (cathepsin A)
MSLRLLTVFLLSLPLLAEPPAEPAEKSEKKSPPTPPANLAPKSIDSSVTIDGKKIDYTATSGKLVINKDDGTPRASVFHVAYQKKGADAAKRPVMFAFNGGPGSSAVWLHIGALGPKIIDLPGDGTAPVSPPTLLKNNDFSILDVADLVFIDPVSTGYSRVDSGGKPQEFHGVEEDVESVGDFIRSWITENKRWSSPKYLLGESYGGVRAAGLAAHLQNRFGMSLNGVVMLSTLMDFQTLTPGNGNDLPYVIFLPTYTSVAHYHGIIQGNRDELVKKARAFAMGTYHGALLEGNELSKEETMAIAKEMSALIGVPATTIAQRHLRIDPTFFRGALLQEKGKVLGRFDARVAWADTDPDAVEPEYDPSYSLAYGAFSTAMLDYLSRDLQYTEDQPYEIITGKVHPWNWNARNGFVNLSSRLSTALRDNPKLRVLVQCGYTDLATPGDGMLHSTRQLLNLPADLRSNIQFEWYEGGHMFYLNPVDLKKMRLDLVSFITKPNE